MNVEQERILKILFVLIWVLVLMHLAAEHYYLYWVLRWFDVLTHFIGGIWIGLASLWLWYFSGYMRTARIPDKRAVFVALAAGLCLGVVWEAYEFGVWYFSGSELSTNYVPDTLLDLCMDTIGALFGYLTFRLLPRRIVQADHVL